ncbi:uncharacterized protein [Amphiura filiformis]|uniref:uncharacterized protein n=1 Tax=Amphiura filiformis TaxID=82378 RepID=UPI003B211A33
MRLAVTLLLLGVTTHVFGKHFRGGTFSWKPLNENKVEVKYSFSFNGFRDDDSPLVTHQRCNVTEPNYGGYLKTKGSLNCEGCPHQTDKNSCTNCVNFDPPPNNDPTSSDMTWLCTDYDKKAGWDAGGRTFEVDVRRNPTDWCFRTYSLY